MREGGQTFPDPTDPATMESCPSGKLKLRSLRLNAVSSSSEYETVAFWKLCHQRKEDGASNAERSAPSQIGIATKEGWR
jgi:hypothetical protein